MVSDQKKYEGPPGWAWSLFFLLLWQILLLAQNPGLMSDDSGEMVAAAFRLGLPHPPGYPLLSLLGHLFTWLPLGSPAYRLNLLSQLLTMISLGVALRTCGKLGGARAQWMLPVFGIVLISYRSLFAQSFTAKGAVYTLTLLLCAGVTHLSLDGFEGPKKIPGLALVCFLWAVGMANHWQTQILWIPFLLFWFWRSRRGLEPRRVILFLSLLVVGLSLYLYLPLRASLSPLPCWGDPVDLKGFIWVVARQLTAGDESWGGGPIYGSHLIEVAKVFGFNWMPGFSLLAVLGLFALGRDKNPFFYSALLLFFPALLAVVDFTLHDAHLIYLVNVYFVSTAGLVLVCGFYGWLWLVRLRGFSSKWLLVLLLAAAAGWLSKTFAAEDKSGYTLAEDLGVNLLKGLPRGAAFLAEGDHYVFPLFYEKYVLGLRPDLAFEPALFLIHDWGWRQWASQGRDLSEAVQATPVLRERLGRIARARQDSGGGFYYSLQRMKFEKVLQDMGGQWIPEGLAFRWEPSGRAPGEIFGRVEQKGNAQRLRGLDDFRGSPGWDFSTGEIYRYYADQYFVPAKVLSSAGAEALSLPLFERGFRFASPAYAFNDLAVALGKMGYPAAARRSCVMALQEDPDYLPGYVNLAQAFMVEGKYPEAVQVYEKIRTISGGSEEWNGPLERARQLQSAGREPETASKTAAEYKALGKRLKENGLSFLAGLVDQTAPEKASSVP